MKIDFDLSLLEKIQSGEYKLMTRSGHSARIVCTDACIVSSDGTSLPLVVLIKSSSGEEMTVACDLNGKNHSLSNVHDLVVLTDEAELTRTEKLFQSYLEDSGRGAYRPGTPEGRTFIRGAVAHLLDFARRHPDKI